jgi:hypothetical protein
MERELKSNYLKIDGSKFILEVYENEPSTRLSDFALKNVSIKFKEDKTIEVTGDKIEWSFAFAKSFLEDMKNKPNHEYVNMGYKNIMDFFKGIKKPYVKMGWYKLDKTTPYHCLMSKWYVVL